MKNLIPGVTEIQAEIEERYERGRQRQRLELGARFLCILIAKDVVISVVDEAADRLAATSLKLADALIDKTIYTK